MRPVALAAVRAGLVDEDMMKELRHWGMLHNVEPIEPYASVEEALTGIEEALGSEDQVQLKKTDLDIMRRYLSPDSQMKGRMVLVDPEEDTRASRQVTFCKLTHRRYVLPWMSQHSPDLFVNGESYLSYKDELGRSTRVSFSSYEELYFGDVKAFLILEAVFRSSGE